LEKAVLSTVKVQLGVVLVFRKSMNDTFMISSIIKWDLVKITVLIHLLKLAKCMFIVKLILKINFQYVHSISLLF